MRALIVVGHHRVHQTYGGANAGRVYLDDDSPSGRHTSEAAGWLAFLDHRDVLSVGAAASSEGTLLQAGMALGF